MRKYDPLFKFLQSQNKTQVILNYEEIEKIICQSLPVSAHKYKVWWDNNSHVQSKAWRDAGYKVTDVKLGSMVTFTKE